VAFFRTDAHASATAAPQAPVAAARSAAPAARPAASPKRPAAAPAKPAAKPNGGGGPVGRMQAALATAVQQDADWKEF